MAKKKASKSKQRYLVGALVCENADSVSTPMLLHFTKMFILFASGDDIANLGKDIYPPTIVVVEGRRAKQLHHKYGIQIKRDTCRKVELLIYMNEHDKSKPKTKIAGPDQGVAFVIGSQKFCMAFMHYISWRGENTCDSVVVRCIRKLAEAKPGDVLYLDSDDSENFYRGNMPEWSAKLLQHIPEAVAST